MNGVATFSDLVLDKVASGYTLQATATGLVPALSNAFSLSPAGASQGSFTVPPPTTATNGGVLSPQPVIQLRDGSGNPVQQAGVVVTASITQVGGGPAAAAGTGETAAVATLGGSTTATTNAQGVATFTNLSITGTAGSYTLSFSAPGMTPLVSPPIALGAGAATQLFIAVQPSSAAQSNTPLPVQPEVQLRDASGNDVSQAGVVVTAETQSGSGSAGGNTTATTDASGRAVFSGLSISGPSGAYTLRFTAPGLAEAISNAIQLGAGGGSRLVMGVQPSASGFSGVPFTQQPTVRIQDASGNFVAQAGIQITAAVSGTASLGGAAVKTTDATGTATFTDLSITGLVGEYQLSFTSSGLVSATSSAIALAAGSATRLALTTQPAAGGASGVPLTTQPVVQIQDVAGNAVSQGGRVVTAAIASGPAGATLGGTVTATSSSSGAATFTNLAITGSSGTYTLQFTATSLASITSGGITLGAGAPTTMSANSVTTQSATVGTAVGAPPSVRIVDASNNPVANVAVTFTVTAGGGTTSPPSPATVNTNASGIATLTSWTLGTTAGTNTVTAAASVPNGSPVTFNATGTAGTANTIAANSSVSQTATVNTVVAAPPSVKVTDANNNPVSGVAVTFTVTAGGGTLSRPDRR